MITLHDARTERAARLVAEAETARAEAWDAANAAQSACLSALSSAEVARHAAWAADSALVAAKAAHAVAFLTRSEKC